MARAKQVDRRQKDRPDAAFLKPMLERATKLEGLRDGVIRFRFSDGGEAVVRCSRGKADLSEEPAALEGEPLIEVMGDRKRIQAIIDGKKDARAQFLAGGLRIRGDMAYFSDIALELGILTEPL
jgi:predicted lipid carrier protein YhbT